MSRTRGAERGQNEHFAAVPSCLDCVRGDRSGLDRKLLVEPAEQTRCHAARSFAQRLIAPKWVKRLARTTSGTGYASCGGDWWEATSSLTSSTVRHGLSEWTTRWQLAQSIAMSLTKVTLSG